MRKNVTCFNLLILNSLDFECPPPLIQNSTSWVHKLSSHSNYIDMKIWQIYKFKLSYHCISNTYVGLNPSFSQAKALNFEKVSWILLMFVNHDALRKPLISCTPPRVIVNDLNFKQPRNENSKWYLHWIMQEIVNPIHTQTPIWAWPTRFLIEVGVGFNNFEID